MIYMLYYRKIDLVVDERTVRKMSHREKMDTMTAWNNDRETDTEIRRDLARSSRPVKPLGGKGRLVRFIFSLVFNIFMMLLLHRMFSPVFEGSDDITIVQFVNGSCGSFDPHMVYQNYLVGLVLAGLYKNFPLVPWYSWFQYAALCAAFTGITYVLTCRVRKGAGFALALLVQAFAAYECYINIQYTKTAGVLAAAGMMLIWNGLWGASNTDYDAGAVPPAGRILWADVVMGIALAVCSILGRYAQFAACAALTAGIPFLMLLDAGRKYPAAGKGADGRVNPDGKSAGRKTSPTRKGSAAGAGRILLRCILMCLFLGALCAGLVIFDRSTYQKDPVWKNYVEYNDTRSELMDYGMPKYEEYEELYTQLGVSRAAYDLFDTWNSGDTAVFSTDVMKKLMEVRETKKPGLSTAKDFLKEVPKGFLKNRLVWCFIAVFCLWIFYGRHDWRAILALAAEAILFGALYYYLFLKGRYLYNRVDVGLWMSVLTVLLWTWKSEHKKMPANAVRAILVLGVMGLCAFVQIPGWKGRLASHCEDSRQRRLETREKMMEISEDKDHLYVSKLGILSASRCCNPFEPMPVGMLSNVALLGGWKVESAPYNALLEKYGFTDNPYEAIAGTSEQAASVYLLDEDPEATLAFLREYYNPDAQMVETGEWNDKIVRQVVTGPQEEPGRQQNQ